ncbi:MAG: MarR family winged helix-turn-helix transcriptional regulator [Gammaproteobacteria bacterium]
MSNNALIEKFLSEELDLSKREITLYLNLIKYGATTVLELSKISSMNRVTTHANVEKLTKKRLVTQVKKGRGSRRLIMAEPIDKLAVILKERKAKIEAAENQLISVMHELAGIKKEYRQDSIMEIRRYTGKKEVKLIYDEMLGAKEIRTYANTGELLKIFPGNIHKFIDAHRKNKDMLVWEIMEDSQETQDYVKQMDPKRFFYKLATKKLTLPTVDYSIFDGKVAMITISNNTVNGVVIENLNFFKIAETIHQFVWESL